MAKAKVKGTSRIQKTISARIAGALAGDPRLKRITENFKETIRSGKLLDGTKIKPLAESTIQRRKRLAEFNSTGKAFSPAKSNITFTGSFLESFATSVERIRNGIILKIAPTGVHKGLKLVRGGKSKGASNQDIAEGLIAGGRDFTKIGEKKQKEIKRVVLDIIRRAVRRI